MIPIAQVRLSHITRELELSNSQISFDECFDTSLINPHGINSTYCTGGDAQARLTNITTKPYQIGKFRGYRHGVVFLFVSPNKLFLYNPDTNVATFVSNYYSGSTDIAMTDNRFWFLYSSNPVNIYEYFFDLRYPETLNFSRSLSSGLNQSAGLCAFNNSVLIMGGEGSIKTLNITTNPATVLTSISISGTVTGDIIYLPTDNAIIATITDGGTKYLRKYNYATGALILSVSINIESYALFTWRRMIYLVTVDGSLRQIHPTTLAISTVGQIAGLGGAVQGACNTPYLNDY